MSDIIQQSKKKLESIKERKATLDKIKDTVFLLDYSGSMGETVEHTSKFDHLMAFVRRMKIDPKQCVSFGLRIFQGFPSMPSGNTPMLGAFRFLRNSGIPFGRMVLISDGYPNDVNVYVDAGFDMLVDEIKRTGKQLDIVFIGDESDGRGEDLMKKLAKACGGTSENIKGTAQLMEQTVTALLTGKKPDNEEEKGPIEL